jgi:hypothetical protein
MGNTEFNRKMSSKKAPGRKPQAADEQDLPLLPEKPWVCQLCQEDGSLRKNVCRNCRGAF